MKTAVLVLDLHPRPPLLGGVNCEVEPGLIKQDYSPDRLVFHTRDIDVTASHRLKTLSSKNK